MFSTEYKLKILSEADQCERGELGPLLRRESLYSNQLQQWRREFAADGVAGLSKSAPGPKARLTAEQKEIERLKLQNQRLQKKLAVAEGCLELQKKALSMLEHMSNENGS
jgi:transposase